MKKKALSIWSVVLLIGTIFTVVFMGNVSAALEEQNVTGIVWKSDGTPSDSQAEFCIWVNHSGVWNRFPDVVAGEDRIYTEIGADGLYWYSYVLPDEGYGLTWADGDDYKVQVDGSLWGELDGNTTSNGTGTDPGFFPPTYDPVNPANELALVNYMGGGGYENEQQWDVRTVAPIDLAPVNITINGEYYMGNYNATGYPATPDTWLTITFNVTNLGFVVTPDMFNITVWNASSINGDPIDINDPVIFWTGQGPLNGSGQPEHEIELTFMWYVPNVISDYWINISVDWGPNIWGSNIPEFNESNNFVVLIIRVGPNLEPWGVEIDGNPYTEWGVYYVGPGEVVTITSNATNSGYSPTGTFNIALHNVSIAGSPIIGDSNPFIVPAQFVLPDFSPDENLTEDATWTWKAPDQSGDFYVNISVDYEGLIEESNEIDNHFTIRFVVAPDLWIQNVSVDGILITDVNGVQIIDIIVTPDQGILITVNATDIGPSSTGVFNFNITYTNCSATGDTGGNISFFNSDALGPILSGEVTLDVNFDWTAPLFEGILDYYINITVDYGGNVSEIDEGNNFFILHLIMDAPDLTPDEVSVEVAGTSVADFVNIPPYVSDIVDVPLGEDIIIWITVGNVGGVNMSIGTNVTFHNISGVGGSNDDKFWEADLPPINAGGTATVSGVWPNPMVLGMYYINISIDWNGTIDIYGRILELDEFNNTFTLIINITPIPVTTLHSSDPTHIYNTTVWYIDSTTDLNFTVLGPNPPFFTWYRIINLTNGSEAQGWKNYTILGGNFKMMWGEGTFRIEYNSTDAVGAEEVTRYKILIVDDQSPLTTITIGTPQYRVTGLDPWNITSSAPITLTAVDHPLGTSIIGIDNASGVAGIYYRIWNIDSGGWVPDWTEYTGAIYLSGNDGYYLIYYNSTDNLGHMEPLNTELIYLDNTGPVTNIIVGDPNSTHPDPSFDWFITSSTPLTLDAFEAEGSGVNQSMIQFRITNTDTGNTSGWTADITFDVATDYPFFAFDGEGNYSIEFRAMDNLGNWGPVDSINVFVDDTPPDAMLIIGDPKYRINATHLWNVSYATNLDFWADDGIGSGLDYTSYHYYDITYDSGWFTYLFSWNISSWIDDGIYIIEFRSYDRLGNNQPFNESVYLDNTPPTTTIPDTYPIGPQYRVDDSDTWNITSTTIFGFSADDGPGCGVNYSEYRVLDIYTTPITNWLPAQTFTLTDTLDDGNYIIEYRSVDWLNNIETDTGQYHIYLDNNGPITSILGGQDDLNTEKNAYNVDFSTQFTLEADDGLGCGVNWSSLEYRVRINGSTWTSWQNYAGAFNLDLADHGYWDHTIEFKAYDLLGNEGPTGSIDLFILGVFDIEPPLPPVLRLRISDDGEDVILEWEPSPDDDIAYYLIYRSTTKTGFDFSSEWVDTSDVDPEGNVIPLRTTWIDTDADLPGDSNYQDQYYYALRGVDDLGNMGYTSNIAGKVTMTFYKGYNTFARPLEPFEDMTASEMLDTEILGDDVFDDGKDTIYRYNTSLQQWVGHAKFMPSSLDDFTLEMGEGYMIYIMENRVEWTFTGSTATSIRYIGGVGEETAFRDSLEVIEVDVDENEVDLEWDSATGATGYTIYRGTARMEEDSLTDYTLDLLDTTTDTTYTDTSAVDDEYYYMVVAMDGSQERSSTYSIGIKRYELSPGYSLISLEAEPKTPQDVAGYSTDMFTLDSNTFYYYDRSLGIWRGHPRFAPENINNVEVRIGNAYMVYVHAEDMSYAFTGI